MRKQQQQQKHYLIGRYRIPSWVYMYEMRLRSRYVASVKVNKQRIVSYSSFITLYTFSKRSKYGYNAIFTTIFRGTDVTHTPHCDATGDVIHDKATWQTIWFRNRAATQCDTTTFKPLFNSRMSRRVIVRRDVVCRIVCRCDCRAPFSVREKWHAIWHIRDSIAHTFSANSIFWNFPAKFIKICFQTFTETNCDAFLITTSVSSLFFLARKSNWLQRFSLSMAINDSTTDKIELPDKCQISQDEEQFNEIYLPCLEWGNLLLELFANCPSVCVRIKNATSTHAIVTSVY